MTLSATEQTQIIGFLGWPLKTLDVGSTHYNKTVVDRLNSLTTDAETLIRASLTRLNNLQTKYDASTSRVLVKQLGDIVLNTDEHVGLSKEYRRCLNDLAQLTDIPLLKRGGANIGVCV